MAKLKFSVYLPGLVVDSVPAFQQAKRIHCTDPSYQDFNQALVSLCPSVRPIAQSMALAEGLGDDKWLRADPVSLQVDLVHVYQQGDSDLCLAPVEVESLLAAINSLMQQYEVELVAPNLVRWYLRCRQTPKFDMQYPAKSLGKPITDFLPKGNENKRWAILFTELQMLLHECEVNQQRRARGAATVDALWFWGSSTEIEQSPNFCGVISDELLLVNLAQAAGLPLFTLSEGLRAVQQRSIHSGHWLLYSNRYQKDEQFAQIVTPLVKQKSASLRLYPGDKHCYYVQSKTLQGLRRFFGLN